MLSHIYIGTSNLARAFDFYAALLRHLQLTLKFHDPDKWAGWHANGEARPLLVLGKPFDGQPAAPGNGPMTSFLAPDRITVDRAYATAMAHGGACEGPPGLRPHYHEHYYGAYFRDLDGNKLSFCCHERE